MTELSEQKMFRRNYYTSDDSGKIYLFGLLVPFAVLFIWSMLGGAICSMANIKFDSNQPPLWYSIINAILGQVAFLVTFLVYNKFTKTAFSAARVRKLSAKNVFLCIGIALIALFGLQFFVSTFDHVISLTGYHLQNDISVIPLDNAGWLVLYVFIYALLPAVCEELIFRGVVLTGLRKSMNDYSAIALSALLFALMHGSLQQLVYPFLLGLIFGLIVIRTGSTLASMIIHFCNNLLVVFFAYLQNNYSFNLFNFQNTWWFYLISALLLVVTAVAIFLIDRFYFKHKNQLDDKVEDDGAKGKISLFLWIGLAVGFAFFLFGTIMNFTVPT